ncbi:hypothetical protein [Gordonia sp. (in: high G+C Gram-positive bacteria)]|uniref:hypothetical protein n=1 Tax=Gordonia sp. (in: high G+C Gram-positive bacteria) TaxID=84139 RepID=UPI003341D277
MTLIPVTVLVLDDQSITITGESTSNPHLAITPAIRAGKDGTLSFADGRIITHIPTGRHVMGSGSFGAISLHKAVEIMTRHADWSKDAPLTKDSAAAMRRELWAAGDSDRGWPWPDWAGDRSTPALSVIGTSLDDAIKRHQATSPEVREKRQAYVDAVTDIDDAKRTIETLLMMESNSRYVELYGMTYALAVLHRLDPRTADRVADHLVLEWDAGDSLGEWMWQWRTELDEGKPLSLRGYPETAAEELIDG